MSKTQLSKRIVSFVKARRPKGYLPVPVITAYMYMESGATNYGKFESEVAEAIRSNKELVVVKGHKGGVALASTHAERQESKKSFRIPQAVYREMSQPERAQARLIRELKKLQKLSPSKFAKLSSVLATV